MERTLVIIKPNAVQRELVGETITRLERRGLKIAAMKMSVVGKELAGRHYQEHKGKAFYNDLIDFISSGPSVAMVLEGERAIEIVRAMCGATDPGAALPGTIRGDYGMSIDRNIIHASDSPAAAEREIGLFFKDDEIMDYQRAAGC